MKRYSKMLDSGIEWIGEIPAHWKILRLKRITEDITGGIPSGEREDNGIIQLRMNNITTDGKIDLEKTLRIPIGENIGKYLLRKHDVILNNTNSIDLVGKTSIVE